MEKELHLLVELAAPFAHVESPFPTATRAIQEPQGTIIDAIKIAKEKRVMFEFVDTPLQQMLNELSEATGVRFSPQKEALASVDVDINSPISLHVSEVPLCAALQGFEDAYPALRFVVRDYGVLLTTKDYAQEQGYLPLLESSAVSAPAEVRY